MRRKTLVIATLLLCVATCLLWWLSIQPKKRAAVSEAPLAENPTASPHSQSIVSPAPIVVGSSSAYPQISLKGKTREEGIREYLLHEQTDHMYDWKIPIRFYGRAIDQNEQPVSNATVRLQWVNRQGSEGVGETQLITDGQGRFALQGVKGKDLSVWISKEGYYDLSRQDNQTLFEFADPSQNWFYQPDSDNPVIFHMRKKGAGEPLVRKSLELQPPSNGTPVKVDLLVGQQSGKGQLQVQTWKPTITPAQIRTGKVFPYDWRIVLNMPGGGFLQENDVFPFEAPESGYNPVIDLSLHATNGASSGVTAQQDCYFCFGQPPKYGVMHFKSDGDRPYLDIAYSLNLSGSRNLEPASTPQQ